MPAALKCRVPIIPRVIHNRGDSELNRNRSVSKFPRGVSDTLRIALASRLSHHHMLTIARLVQIDRVVATLPKQTDHTQPVTGRKSGALSTRNKCRPLYVAAFSKFNGVSIFFTLWPKKSCTIHRTFFYLVHIKKINRKTTFLVREVHILIHAFSICDTVALYSVHHTLHRTGFSGAEYSRDTCALVGDTQIFAADTRTVLETNCATMPTIGTRQLCTASHTGAYHLWQNIVILALSGILLELTEANDRALVTFLISAPARRRPRTDLSKQAARKQWRRLRFHYVPSRPAHQELPRDALPPSRRTWLAYRARSPHPTRLILTALLLVSEIILSSMTSNVSHAGHATGSIVGILCGTAFGSNVFFDPLEIVCLSRHNRHIWHHYCHDRIQPNILVPMGVVRHARVYHSYTKKL